MPTPYVHQALGTTVRKQLGETDDQDAKLDLLVSALEDLTNGANSAFQSVGFSINSAGGEGRRQQNISADYQVASTDGSIFADCTAAGRTATLPEVTKYPTMTVMVQRDTGANTFTVAASTTDVVANTVTGLASISVTGPVWLQSDGVSNWRVIG